MVVEVLRFSVGPDEFDSWSEIDRETWTAFLQRQPGFVRKEVWRGTGTEVCVVVWWRSQDDWNAVSVDQISEVDTQMGRWFRASTVEAFTVV